MALELTIVKKNTLPSSVDYRSKVAGVTSGTLLVSKYGGSVLYRSTNGGDTWTTETFPLSFCDCLEWNGSYFLGVYNGSWCKSATGAPGSWTTGSLATPRGNQRLAWNGAMWVLARLYGGGNAEMAYSSDGTTWNYSSLTATTDAYDVIWDGARWCALGNQEASPFNQYFWSSPTGATWTQGGQIDGVVGNTSGAMVYTGTAFVTSSGPYYSPGSIGYSPTGATWAASAQTGRLICAAAGVALKDDGAGANWMTSINGNIWSTITPTVIGTGTFEPTVSSRTALDGKAYFAGGTLFTSVTLANSVPPFWTSLVGAYEAI